MNFFWHDSKKLIFFFSMWLKELTFLKKYDSKNLTSFLSMTQRIELTFVWIRLNESIPFFWMWLNWNFGWKVKKWTFFYSKLNFSSHDSKNWTFFFSIWLKELFLNLDSKNWTFYYLTQRVELFSYLTPWVIF